MAYTKTTDFAAKDALATGNPAKVVKGTEIGAEFDAIQTADALNLKRDGTSTPSANIPMNGYKLTGLAAGSTAGDSVRYEQFASPPAIGGTAAAAVTGTTITATTQFSGPGTGLTGTAASLTAGTATTATTATSATTATNIAGGSAGTIPYQTGSGTTSMVAAGTSSQVLKGGSTPSWVDSLTAAGYQVASGSAINFTSIPSTVKRIHVMFYDVSVTGSDDILIQIGDSGGLETTSYVSASVLAVNGSGNVGVTSTSGFVVYVDAAVNAITGIITICLANSSLNLWIASGSIGYSSAASGSCTGNKALSATLDRLSIVTTGASTFDGGAFSVLYD